MGKKRVIDQPLLSWRMKICLYFKNKNVALILSSLFYLVDCTGRGWRGKRIYSKEADLKPTADLNHIIEESVAMERENFCKFQGLFSFHVGGNLKTLVLENIEGRMRRG